MAVRTWHLMALTSTCIMPAQCNGGLFLRYRCDIASGMILHPSTKHEMIRKPDTRAKTKTCRQTDTHPRSRAGPTCARCRPRCRPG